MCGGPADPDLDTYTRGRCQAPGMMHACLREGTHCQQCPCPSLNRQPPRPPASFSQLRKPEGERPVLGHTPSANRGGSEMGVTIPPWLPLPRPFHNREEEENGEEGRRHSGRVGQAAVGQEGSWRSRASVVLGGGGAVGSCTARLERWFPPPGLGTSCPAHMGPGPGGASASGSAPWEAGLLNKSRTGSPFC